MYDNNIVDLMTKLSEEQQKNFEERMNFKSKVQSIEQMAEQKVNQLENELKLQAKFIDEEVSKYELENK